PLAVLPPFRPVVLLVTVVQERGQVLVRPDPDVAPLPPIPTRWPAARHALLPAERDRARPARARIHVDDDVINEHCCRPYPPARRRPRAAAAPRTTLPTPCAPDPRSRSPVRTPAPIPPRP